ncbi:hypothetical protein [Aquipseudomonas alcaligenes]|uniref:hypothetical protein n=1 Tax=Aquipseudomonas alcaligenes TaxID=43263 RepID=UPI0011C02B04|nr:hypothetical protein [Pseudomonas alcaligenes]
MSTKLGAIHFAEARQTRTVRQVEKAAPVVQPGQLRVSPGQELEGRKRLWQRQNAFYEKVCTLAEVLTLKETAERVGVSVRFLKNFAYDWDVEFRDEPRTYSVGKADREISFATIADTWSDTFRGIDKPSSSEGIHANH